MNIYGFLFRGLRIEDDQDDNDWDDDDQSMTKPNISGEGG